MDEIAVLLEALINEVSGLREDVQSLKGEKGINLSDIARVVEGSAYKITGKDSYNLGDLYAELSRMSSSLVSIEFNTD